MAWLARRTQVITIRAWCCFFARRIGQLVLYQPRLRKSGQFFSNGWFALFLLGVLTWLLQWYGLMGHQAARLAMPFHHDVEALIWAGLLLCSLGPLTPCLAYIFQPASQSHRHYSLLALLSTFAG